MDKTKLMVNCAYCDTRKVTPSILEQYEGIMINSAMILVSPKSKELLAAHQVTLNAAKIVEMEEGAELVKVNGNFILNSKTSYKNKSILHVNGSLYIESDMTAENFKNIAGITVNGSLTYPEGLQCEMPPFHVNGSVETYPSDAVRLADRFTLDKYFVMRAKGGRYYAAGEVIIEDTEVDLRPLADKNTLFLTRKALVAEELLEGALCLFEENVSLEVIPAGFVHVDSCTLTERLLREKGRKLYVTGNLAVTDESIPALAQLEDIKIKGSVRTFPRLKELLSDSPVRNGEIVLMKGNCMSDKTQVKLDRLMLERHPDGIRLVDCQFVRLEKDITPGEIEDLLEFEDCGVIYCTPEQRGSVDMTSQDVGKIVDNEDEGQSGVSGLLESIMGKLPPEYKDCRMINVASYEF